MLFTIADGSSKDIAAGDMVQVIDGVLPDDISMTDVIPVIGVFTYAIQISIIPQGRTTVITTDLSAAAITAVWRKQ